MFVTFQDLQERYLRKVAHSQQDISRKSPGLLDTIQSHRKSDGYAL